MEEARAWLWENRQWVFSGIGVAALTGACALVARLLRSRYSRGEGGAPDSVAGLVVLPNGDAIPPEGVDGVKISGTGPGRGPYNVCLVYHGTGHTFQTSIYFTHSLRRARKVAAATTEIINRGKARNRQEGQPSGSKHGGA